VSQLALALYRILSQDSLSPNQLLFIGNIAMETMNTSDGPMWVNVLRLVFPLLQSRASKNVPPSSR
jgi:hypothetical protein